jgi:L-seryl-tRNA(Ser) seleniumtransferase
MSQRSDWRERYGLRPIINASGTMTVLGASIVVPEAQAAIAGILGEFVEVDGLQRVASRVIARLTGAEAGCLTASAAAAISIAVAGAMTGPDLAAIERLPDAAGLKDEVVVQAGHLINYGAPVEQAIRLAGARVVTVGQATEVRGYQLAGAIGPRTAAALYVVSHHTVQVGQLPLGEFAALCRERGVPVIVDAASEYDLKGFLAAGGDVALYSAQKFLGGPTAGIVAGRRDLVRAAYLQSRGIGRGLKVGKEGMVGAIAALEAWERRDHAAARAREQGHLRLWQQRLADRPGVAASIVPDPTGNPLDRLLLRLDAAGARITAWDLADRLAAGQPPVMVRDDEVEQGYFFLDPCNLHEGEAAIVADRLAAELERARAEPQPVATPLAERRRRHEAAVLAWPD